MKKDINEFILTEKMNMGFSGALTILFIGLKLTHYIDWNWWLILSPTLIPLGIILSYAILIIFVSAFTGTPIKVTRKKK